MHPLAGTEEHTMQERPSVHDSRRAHAHASKPTSAGSHAPRPREEELEDIGFYEYADAPEGIVLVEWSDKFPDAMPEDYIEVAITRGDGAQRTRRIRSRVGQHAAFHP